MGDLEKALDQAGYRDDGVPVSFGPWANAWYPAWESPPPRGVSAQTFSTIDALPREVQGVSTPDGQKVPLLWET